MITSHNDTVNKIAQEITWNSRRIEFEFKKQATPREVNEIRKHYNEFLKTERVGTHYEGLPVDANIQIVSASAPGRSGISQGITHIVLEEELKFKKITRKAGQRLCTAKDIGESRHTANRAVECPRCKEIAERIKRATA